MKRLSFVVALCLVTIVAGCNSKSPTAPTPTVPTFTFPLTTSNEVPAISNAESTGSGSVTIKLNVTRDAANTITAATVDFTVTLTGFPATTAITVAHIHEAAAGVNGPVRVNTGLAAGEVTLVGGAGGFTKNAVNVTDLTIIQRILDSPSAFYFNVHSTLNPGGVVRAQLVRTQ
jgi:CHRD domain